MSEAEPDSDNEPTMEEILASIRKIISEDEPDGSEGAEPASDAAAEEPDEEPQPLELTQMIGDDGNVVDLRGSQQASEPDPEPEQEPEEAPDGAPPDAPDLADEAESDIELEAEESVPMADNTALAQEAPADAGPSGPGGLVSASTAALATSAMAQISDNLESESPVTSLSGGDKTLEALVREALAAHLKDWLDANLPNLVEAVVREEIQKMVKRAEYR